MTDKPTITQQPAAWMYRSEEYTHCFLYKADDGSIFKRQKGWDETPLYSESVVAELQAEVDRLREALQMAAKQFRFYEESHLLKETTDGIAKAVANRRCAEQCEIALAKKEPVE